MNESCAVPKAGTALGGCDAFTVTTDRHGTVLLVAVEGRIDGETVGRLENAVRAGRSEPCRSVVMDLAKVSVILSAGLKLLLALGKLTSGRDGSLAIAVPEGPVREVLAVSGFDRIFPVFDDPAEAVSDMARGTR